MKHFDKAASKWDEPWKIESSKVLASEIKKAIVLKDGISILDFGCGTGLLGSEFIEQANRLLGIDCSVGMLKAFDEKFSGYKNIESLNINLEIDSIDEKFDLIISAMAFHHLDHPKAVFEKLVSMLNKDGVIAIVDLDKEDGTFHPDNEGMGVKHFGFSKDELANWNEATELNFSSSIIKTIDKNDQSYGQFLAIYRK